jgi:hypothetical protein
VSDGRQEARGERWEEWSEKWAVGGRRREVGDWRREARGERREARGERREARGERREARGVRQEVGGGRQEAGGMRWGQEVGERYIFLFTHVFSLCVRKADQKQIPQLRLVTTRGFAKQKFTSPLLLLLPFVFRRLERYFNAATIRQVVQLIMYSTARTSLLAIPPDVGITETQLKKLELSDVGYTKPQHPSRLLPKTVEYYEVSPDSSPHNYL